VGWDLPLRHLVDGVDVVDALGVRGVALVHRIEAQEPRFAARIGLAPLTDRDGCGAGFGVVQPALAIALTVAQVVEMAVGDVGQPLELSLAVDLKLALENRPRRWPGERLVGLVDLGQQLDIGLRVTQREAMPAAGGHPHLAAGLVASNQPRNLRPAQPRHLLKVAPQQTASRLALPGIAVLDQHRLHPAVHLFTVFALKAQTVAGQYQQTNLLQTQLLGFVHADLQSSA